MTPPVYVDTSVLVAAYYPEKISAKAQRHLSKTPVAISPLTCLEFSSAVAKKMRGKELTKAEAQSIIAMFNTNKAQHNFSLLEINAAHYTLAGNWLDSLATPLRTLDTIHLAVASTAAIPLLTADKIMAQAGKLLGVEIMTI